MIVWVVRLWLVLVNIIIIIITGAIISEEI